MTDASDRELGQFWQNQRERTLAMSADEVERLGRDLPAQEQRRVAGADMRAWWRAAAARYPDLDIPKDIV